MSKIFAHRRRSLLKAIRMSDADALLVTNETNVTYLTGFTGDSTWLLVSPGGTLAVSDGRYTTQLQEQCPDVEAFIRKTGTKLAEETGTLLDDLVKQTGKATVGVESGSITFAAVEALRGNSTRAELVSTEGLVEDLRMIKDESEVAAIREAVRLNEAGFDYLVNRLTSESTEIGLAHDLEHCLRQFGGAGFSFPAIIGVDDRAALPHYSPGDVRVGQASLVLVDWGTRGRSGYISDLTRTIVSDHPPKKLSDVYEAVREANEAGIAAIRPGATGVEVDAAARNVLEERGLEKWFTHSLGHGVGLNVHEAPSLGPTSPHTLEAGMVVTVEPGVYIPGRIGVRIEDDVLVTEDGCEVLSSLPKDIDAYSHALAR